jgi:Spy/CpxP family protein refolding chaperone
MKKLLLGLLIAGFVLTNTPISMACSKGKASSCATCQYKAKTCKITKLKSKTSLLWTNQECMAITDEQLEKVKVIKHKAIKELIQLKADVDIIKVDVTSLLYADSMDLSKVNKLIDAKYSKKNKTAKTYVKAVSDIQKILTEEQRAKWQSSCSKGSSDCAKCASSSGPKICPITGKTLGDKGSSKGSMK